MSKKHLTIIADEKKKYLISDLRHLSNPRILRVPEWRIQAESILKTQKHHGRSIPTDIYEEFAPKIKEALRTAA
jgi:hypothetical protein